MHEAATVEDNGRGGVGSQEEKVIMINDVARAFFEAKATRKICVELPEECAESLGGRNVALLNRSLYGTRRGHELARRSCVGNAPMGVQQRSV